MAQFAYTAVNQSGKKLSGSISAPTEDAARKQLNTLGVALLTIEQTAETPVQTQTAEPGTSSELQKFEFEAYDKLGKRVVGTIPASSRYKAFQRLVDEYGFEVSYVVKIGASDEEKEKAKREDLSALKAEYAQTSGVVNKQDENVLSQEFEEKRMTLLKKVDFILNKIKNVLLEYDKEIKPENRQIIQKYIDKLLRIKSSTNLDYIQHVSEELLKKVQDQELFLHKEKMLAARNTLKLESLQMMSDLHSKPTQTKDISDDISKIKTKLGASKIKVLQGLSQYLTKFIPSPEAKELKNKIRTISRQVWAFRKIWFTSPKMTKPEAYKSLQQIIEEKKRLVTELKTLKNKKNQKPVEEQAELTEPLIVEEITNFLAWLLGFYLIAYFLSHYVMAKIIPSGNPLPGDFNLLDSVVLRYLLISVFLWYVLLSMRLKYFRYQSWANGLVLGVGILLNASLVFNL
ncbi:hypothetical protein KKC94_05200 [Patescibacteria group bacterium]|nr:hypothetical protein [Patescibacteria group bacterium]